MTEKEIDEIVGRAVMIVSGYAFLRSGEEIVTIVSLREPHHAIRMREDGEMLETNMYEIEQGVVMKYWERNKRIMNQSRI